MVLGIADIAAEGILLAGGARAILLQVADPAVAAGVARHSDFAARPYERLVKTMTYVYGVVYGDDRERAAVRRAVGSAHTPVHGPANEAGPAYNAYDPQLQLWVAATLYDTAIDVYERVFGALDDDSAERIYRDYAVLGTALQVPPGAWPADRAAFRSYWAKRMPSLTISADARRIAADLLGAERAPLWIRAVMPLVRRITVVLLPTEVRRGYGLRLTPATTRRVDRWFAVCRVVYPRLPRRIRFAFRDALMRRLARSVREARAPR
jgi:uncharacterized protein (DUF2236 family)